MTKLCILLLLAVASAAYAEVITQYLYYKTQEKPKELENQPGCYLEEYDRVFPFDQITYPDKTCTQITCDSETWNAYKTECSTVKAKKGCKVIDGNPDEKYPACCSREVCDQ